MTTKQTLKVGGKTVEVSNLDKVFYPKTGFTKGDVLAYYLRIAPVLLPHLKNRPVTLKRYPDGVEAFFFYEKQCPSHAPSWVKTVTVPKTDGCIDYLLLNDLPSLLWVTNLANLELHPFLHRAASLERPTQLVFDLDPGPPANLLDCARVALRIRELFENLGLRSFAKTSGSKGLQIAVPLNTATDYEKTGAFARAVALLLAGRFPKNIVSEMKKEKRKGKVFIDWSQNSSKKTTVSVYSLRAREHPTVSTPVTWEELADAIGRKTSKPLVFEAAALLQRVEENGDLFEPLLTLKQKLPALEAVE
ncbi:MAG TPA: non-homologous end-joining DNA ligase [Chthoniobacteraceae bacterium]|nr:non-homologous end-joining DNA ligase [Chthoniobacteraceae bacterium]